MKCTVVFTEEDGKPYASLLHIEHMHCYIIAFPEGGCAARKCVAHQLIFTEKSSFELDLPGDPWKWFSDIKDQDAHYDPVKFIVDAIGAGGLNIPYREGMTHGELKKAVLDATGCMK
jgi:hypothetical protein